MFETALLVGGAFGARHAFEADHVAAVATLVDDEDRPASTGVAWGVGHSVPVVVLGVVFVALELEIPTAATTAFEAVVGVVLIALGVRVIAGREASVVRLLRHVHGSDGSVGTGHFHLTIGGRTVGLAHSHANGESFAVGVLHGLAGSGGVVVALAATAPTTAAGVEFLAGFSVASIAAMAVASWGWGRVTGVAAILSALAGLASVGVGALLLAEVALQSGLI